MPLDKHGSVWYNTFMLNDINNKTAGSISQQTNGSRSVFARIMSTENITVVFDPKSKDAWFDTNSRVLNMPNWTGMTNEVYDLLLSHEVSHALHTPKDGWISLTDELAGEGAGDADKQVARQYINIVEDARIERLIKAKYPGLARDYNTGYKWLLDSGMFGKMKPQDISNLPFIDRINLHFKVGTHTDVSIPFSPEEQTIVDMIGEAETFEDVAKVSRLVWDHATTGESGKMSPKNPGQNGEGEGNGDNGEDGEGYSEGEEGGGKPGQQAGKKQNRVAAPQSRTATAQDSFLKNHREQGYYGNAQDKAGTLPTLDLTKIIVPSSTIYGQIDEAFTSCTRCAEWMNHARLDYANFTNEANATVDAMVKAFMLKKAATAHHRQQQAKTGTLDCNLLSTYKWNEDLFKHFTIKPNGKNHGFILFLDWSGSMGPMVVNVIKQMYILTSFFRRIGVPFDVYAFSSHQPSDKYYADWHEYHRSMYSMSHEEREEANKQLVINPRHDTLEFYPFYLYHFASSTMKGAEYKKAMESLYIVANTMVTSPWNSDLSLQIPVIPSWLSLGDTPLDQTMIAANQLVQTFQQKHRIEVMNAVVITDGSTSGSPLEWSRCTRLLNPKTGASFGVRGNLSTNVLAAYLKDNTGCNTIMLFLDTALSGSNVGIPGNLLVNSKGEIRQWASRRTEVDDAINAQWTKDNFIMAVPYNNESGTAGPGFDSVFAIRVPRKADTTEQTFQDMDIENTGYSRLKSQFVKSLKSRIVSRSLVNRMVEAMAKHT